MPGTECEERNSSNLWLLQCFPGSPLYHLNHIELSFYHLAPESSGYENLLCPSPYICFCFMIQLFSPSLLATALSSLPYSRAGFPSSSTHLHQDLQSCWVEPPKSSVPPPSRGLMVHAVELERGRAQERTCVSAKEAGWTVLAWWNKPNAVEQRDGGTHSE